MPDAFLDSTALIELVFRNEARRARVVAAIPADGRRLSSRYVIFEIARSFLRTLILLHNKAEAARRMSQVRDYAEGGHTRAGHRYGTIVGAFMDYQTHLERIDGRLSPQQALAEFRGWISTRLRRGWRRLLREAALINPTHCRSDLIEPTKRDDGCYDQLLPRRDCGKPDNCGLQVYFHRHSRDFAAICEHLAGLSSPDAETRNRVAALRRLMEIPSDTPFDGKDCWRVGDAIICHESPAETTVVTKNVGHFRPICDALGRSLTGYR